MQLKQGWGYVTLLIGFLSLFFGGLALSSDFSHELLIMNNMIEQSQSLTGTFQADQKKHTFILFMGVIFSVFGAYMMKEHSL